MTDLTIYRPPSTAIVTINIDEKTVYIVNNYTINQIIK